MFLRFWTLYNSIFHSNFMMSKLKLWSDGGKKELNHFLATLGIPESEYNQQYKHMNFKYKKILREKIESEAPKFGLEGIMFNSYIRQIDAKTQINAADLVYAVTSLLECPRSVMIDDVSNMEEEKGLFNSADLSEEEEKLASLENAKQVQIDNFWAAYSALDLKNKKYIEYGIHLAKEMQLALTSKGTSLIVNKEISLTERFRYSIINNDSLCETKLFHYPMAIQKLALFIMEAYREQKRMQEDKPFVL